MKVYQYPGGRTVRAGSGARGFLLLGTLSLAAALCLFLTGCADTQSPSEPEENSAAVPAENRDGGVPGSSEEGEGAAPVEEAVELPEGVLAAGNPSAEAVYRIALCGDASDPLTEDIAERFRSRLDEIGREQDALFALSVEYAGQDAAVGTAAGPWAAVPFTTLHGAASQAVSRLPDGSADLLAGIGTLSGIAMRDMADRAGSSVPEDSSDTTDGAEGTELPVVFTGWENPVSTAAEFVSAAEYENAVEELYAAGNVSGVTVSQDWERMVNLITALEPEAKKVGLLYNPEDEASAAAVSEVVKLFQAHGVELVERTGSTADEIQIAAQSLAEDGVDAVFTPDDSAVLEAEGIVSGVLTEAGIPHYAASAAFAKAGAFLGYGADPDALGRAMADLAAAILLGGGGAGDVGTAAPAAAVNGQICAALGRDSAAVLGTLEPLVPAILVPGT